MGVFSSNEWGSKNVDTMGINGMMVEPLPDVVLGMSENLVL
jgi:hypothetical protein